MDIFRFINPTAPTKLEQGRIINGLKSKMWIERYAEGGEFKLVADVKSGVRNRLPIGSFISHTDTTEIMIVENHEIVDSPDKDSEIVISGRGFETFLENRIIGSNKTFPTSDGVQEYILSAGYIWNQIVTLIGNHILASALVDDNNAIPYVSVETSVGGTGTSVERSLRRGSLYPAVLDLLELADLGIKVIRPGPWSPLGGSSPNIDIVIHVGVDRSDEIIFSADTGEITSAEYLWSNKSLKNAAMVFGNWIETVVTTGQNEYARRMMLIDASDIDNAYKDPPHDPDLTDIVTAMQRRGTEALAAQNEVALTKAEVSKNITRTTYRKDFDVGDIITVNGSYNETTAMRISEYVEIEDEYGFSGYPTLSLI